MTPEELVAQRHHTHGVYEQMAMTSQQLKSTIRTLCPKFVHLKPEHQEALDMICVKLSRIMCGNDMFKDHWDDIAGYATLGAMATEPAAQPEEFPDDVND